MKQVLSLIILILLTVSKSTGMETLILEGVYQGKNIYVQNTIPESGVGYSVFEVRVNGVPTSDELNSWAIEIDLASLDFGLGDTVLIKIYYKPGPQPKVLNPEVLLFLSTFDIVSQQISTTGEFTWTTTNENGSLTFVIEQYKWNRWVKSGEVYGIGTPTENNYYFEITPHSGENKVRVYQLDFTKEKRYSKPLTFQSEVKEVKFKRVTEEDKFIFSDKTLYEIYDYNDRIAMRGYGEVVNYINLPKGPYYLYYDNKTTSFSKISE
ncbi:MAG: hypothetical protein P1U41_10400 [Vicingaceae bacterium]|nr:hypothetical protein [Vicingaceae bacterium]